MHFDLQITIHIAYIGAKNWFIYFYFFCSRPTGSAEVYFSESSMKDGFGLRFVYKFINMPFLMLQV